MHVNREQRDDVNTGKRMEHTNPRPLAPGESHGIPYRSLIPKGLSNVLTVGKNISCDREVQGSVRVMPPCLVTGQAAGTAAAMAAHDGAGVRDIDIKALRAQLKKDGAYFI